MQSTDLNFDLVMELLRSDGSIVVNKNLVKNIGLDCAVVYSELASKYLYFKSRGELTDDGFFYNTVDNLEADTGLSDYQQRGCIKKLKKLGLVDNKVKGLPAKRYFKVIPSLSVLSLYLQPQQNQQNSKNYRTGCVETTELIPQKLQGNNTKDNTNKNTNKKKAPDSGKPEIASVDNLSEDAKEICSEFFYLYTIAQREPHPMVNNAAIDKLNKLLTKKELYDPDTMRTLPLDKKDLLRLIKAYFTVDYPLSTGGFADRRIWHFLSDGVLKNLYYKELY